MKHRLILSGAVLLISFSCASLVFAQAVSSTVIVSTSTLATSTAATPQITFPIPALGNCASKDACHAYCEVAANMQACTTFAQSHGLVTKEAADKSKKFATLIQSADGGPGGCTTPQACAAFCATTDHLDACVAFAKLHGLDNNQSAQGEKILKFIKSGGQLPGGCTSQDSCEAYCSNLAHAAQCLQFAQSAGITSSTVMMQGPGMREDNDGSSTPRVANINILQKFAELVASGETPGGCTTIDTCQTYCSVATHREECLTFAVKAGLVSAEQANERKESGFKGPGGCDSQESCAAYCADTTHQAECMAFAKERGLNASGTVPMPLRNGSGTMPMPPAFMRDGSGTRDGGDSSGTRGMPGIMPMPPKDFRNASSFPPMPSPMPFNSSSMPFPSRDGRGGDMRMMGSSTTNMPNMNMQGPSSGPGPGSQTGQPPLPFNKPSGDSSLNTPKQSLASITQIFQDFLVNLGNLLP
jgi:hypothetical protein